MSIDEIKKLNPKEKIILMNEIWESFEGTDKAIESPHWHKEVLDERVSKMNSNDAKYISLEELKSR